MPVFRTLILGSMLGASLTQLGAAETPPIPLRDELRLHVENIAGGIGPRSVGEGDTLARTANYIDREFKSAGWPVRRQSYSVARTRCDIVIAERRGTHAPHEIVVVGAHYDSVPVTPGADDNASGVAALITLADRLRTFGPGRTLRLVAFPNEEPIYFQTELMGSRVYAKGCRTRDENIVAMISLESMGYYSDKPGSQRYPSPLNEQYPSEGNFLAIVGNEASRSLVETAFSVFRQHSELPVESAALPAELPGIGWSDHWAFWQEGYKAIMFTDTAVFRNPHYHKPSDTPDTLNYRKLALAVEGVEGVVKALLVVP